MRYVIEDNLAERWEPRTKLRKPVAEERERVPGDHREDSRSDGYDRDKDYGHTLSVIMRALRAFPEAHRSVVSGLRGLAFELPESLFETG